jgi:ATP-dependent Lon protease
VSKISKPINAGKPITPAVETEAKAAVGDRMDDTFDLPTVDEDIFLTGAAADAADLDEKRKDLPRILRVALLIEKGSQNIHDRLIADIESLRPGLPLTAAFATVGNPATALALARDLDRCAVVDDVPALRQITDCVRLVCLPMEMDLASSDDYRRVTQTLWNAIQRLPGNVDPQVAADVETFCVGWAMIPALKHRLPLYRQRGSTAATHPGSFGGLTATRRIDAAETAVFATLEAQQARQTANTEVADDRPTPRAEVSPIAAPGQHQCLVARLSEKEMKHNRLKDLMSQFQGIINVALPLSCHRGLDPRWIASLDTDEHAAIASALPGGSVRQLRRLVEVILHDRDANATRN